LRPLAEKWRTIPTLFFSVLSRKFWTILPSGKGHAARLSTPPLSLCVCVCVCLSATFNIHNFDIFTCN
jgi:hypothetical protein